MVAAIKTVIKILSSALADVSKLKPIEIQQVFLEKGHTMMEVNSVYSTLEKCFTPPLYLPADYAISMRKARPSQPYIIRHVDYKFLRTMKQYLAISHRYVPEKKQEIPLWPKLDHCCTRTVKLSTKCGMMQWNGPFYRRGRRLLYEEAQCLYIAPRKVEKSKFDSLQSLKL
ncbi:unnamed protein product [Parnassius apollo]|uniref:(apollo) hypothetical protein n=1 Tax=Parnassius apollo TaxID=110799 RepID=A0A8S3W6R3_PARAO|nr:unnamed protein product [Parnassius apollo]